MPQNRESTRIGAARNSISGQIAVYDMPVDGSSGERFCDFLNNSRGTVLPPCASKCNRDICFALMNIVGQEKGEKIPDFFHKLSCGCMGKDIVSHLFVRSSEFFQCGNKVRVGQETYVEEQVYVLGNTILEAKGYKTNCELLMD